MIPELFPIQSRLLSYNSLSAFPVEDKSDQIISLPDMQVSSDWSDVAVVTPRGVIIGSNGTEKVPTGYERWVFDVSHPYAEGWPTNLSDDVDDTPFAIVQVKDVLMAHVFSARVVGVNVRFENDSWRGIFSLNVHRVKRLIETTM